MKAFMAVIATLLMFNQAYADNHSEPNYSKFQSNYYFTCPQPAACVSAFEEMLAAPDIAEKNFEVSLRPWAITDGRITHMVFTKSAERYPRLARHSSSPAFATFRAGARWGSRINLKR